MVNKKPCIYCGEETNLVIVEKQVPGRKGIPPGPANFVRCETCYAEAMVSNWNHPIVQSQVCLVCHSAQQQIAEQEKDLATAIWHHPKWGATTLPPSTWAKIKKQQA